MERLRGKTALVTGASRGIGRRIAVALAEQGMNLVLSARSSPALERAATACRSTGVRVAAIAADLGRRSEVESLAARAEAESDGITVLVNNAAIERAQPYEEAE
ncbi:MAG TPA: SDR family NAD(P)-dependent oxidoreductase, partial [Longimicrobiales bacterium]|nr:SDR family NAD(P)-dependent oxidoreductase [Longimicrobiales bacterium]